MTFKNLDEYFKYVKKQIKSVLEQIAEEVRKELYDTVNDNLYKTYNPKQYQRTYELLNSISKTEIKENSDGEYYVVIYYDTDKILAYPSLSNLTGDKNEYGSLWGQHADFYGNDVSEYIPLWIEHGTSGVNNPYHRKGIYAIDEVKEWIEKEFNNRFKKKLLARGIKVK